jgi:hypothetical protein
VAGAALLDAFVAVDAEVDPAFVAAVVDSGPAFEPPPEQPLDSATPTTIARAVVDSAARPVCTIGR